MSFLSLAGPFVVARFPPLTDYPNHLARFWLIGGGALDPVMARFYRIDWFAAVTNVGVDHAVAILSAYGSAMALGRLATVLGAVLPPLGVFALNLALFRRLSPWQALFPVAAWSTTYLMGFLNFQIGLGLALLFVAGDPLVQPRLHRAWVLVRIPFGLVLATDHLFAVIFYGALLMGLGVGPGSFRPWDGRALAGRVWRGGLAAAWCLIPLLFVAAHPHALPGAQPPLENVRSPIQYNVMPGKLATLFSPLASYNVFQELVIAAALAAFLYGLHRSRALWAHAGLMVAAVVLILLAILMPSRALGASWVDRRFPIMALFCVLAAVRLEGNRSPRFALAVASAGLGLSCLQSAWVAWNWRAMEVNLNQVMRVLAQVPAGAAILPLQHDPVLALKWGAPAGRYMFGVGDATFRHFDAIAVPLRHAFVPNLFSARGLQPLRILGPWDEVVEHNGGDLASVAALTRAPVPGEASYIAGWQGRFDYVLVLNADMPDQGGPFHPPADLKLVSDQRFVQLWRVDHGPMLVQAPTPRQPAPASSAPRLAHGAGRAAVTRDRG